MEVISNNVTVNVVDPTLENEQLYQEDSLNITGTPELVYQGTLSNNSQIILEQADFDVTTLEKTTYYLVYHYKNNGNQDDQQGKSFSGAISVRLIENKTSNNTAVSYITALAANSNELINDESVDHNIRYVGSNPNNYVSFNNELWRIIGVMNNIDDGTGKKESRLKIIRNEPYSTEMAWDTDNVNDWTTASLQEELNTTYLNSIQSPYKEMISNVVWNLGGSSTHNDVITSMFYERERDNSVYSERPTEWIGHIGLMYPSDYGYATSGGSTTDRSSCLAKELYNWDSSSYSDCKNNDWLYESLNDQWTLTPYSSDSNRVFYVHSNGIVSRDNSDYTTIAVSPVLYLTSNVRISGGSGSSNDPYNLSL